MAQRFSQAGDGLLPITALTQKWRSKISNIGFKRDNVFCGSKEGGSRPFFLPARLFEQAVPDIVAMAELIESIATQPVHVAPQVNQIQRERGGAGYRQLAQVPRVESDEERKARLERELALCANVGETPTPFEFTVEGEFGIHG